jgi:hypothetical protein
MLRPGARFDYHADLQHFVSSNILTIDQKIERNLFLYSQTIDVIDQSTPITSKLPTIWNVQDEA